MPVATHTVELYGGAMRVRLPTSMTDASDFRQVPDNQEVYTDADTGASLIVELLSRQHNVANADAGAFFYHDLAKDNGCPLDQIEGEATIELPPNAYPLLSASPSGSSGAQRCDYACLTTGLQRISKYTNEAGRENDVFVGLAVLRFTAPLSTEILVSFSCPTRVHPDSSEAKVVKRLLTEAERQSTLQQAIASLEVVEWGLFVPEE
ncbi:putative Ran-binding protein [Leptomonas pyrrhocoris]|uniref:Putative Ran-binding protein n=1 Tax=Leptomonas pyrrhocoris TaxID=157538 RepID=A0A0M9G740_LEPPY|nr:putative Ran-binding protein [Leptomonas pyrrhocoris]KPA83833.1 putative Ran-binding protein [Leptomonas pyrrhocoris]|eukprot:XP_015662272.1 putative Ran-binding protein [Leptomonas pyrrhocoris]